MKIGEEVKVHGYIDEIRSDIIIIRNAGGYFGTVKEEVESIQNSVSEVDNNYIGAAWIPCAERCPDPEERAYWVCTDCGHQCECRWTNVNHIWTELTRDWHWHIMDIPQYCKVVAWMPLPKPYKESAGSEE